MRSACSALPATLPQRRGLAQAARDRKIPGSFASPIGVELRFDDGSNVPCPLFVGRYLRGVQTGRRRPGCSGGFGLWACGRSRPWSTYELHDAGLQPAAACVDADKLNGPIHARLARPGERLEALDGKVYELDPTMTVIADESGPVGIAGIMGGVATGVTPETTRVFLEAAYFDPIRTATTGRKLGINSDARYRFERGVDPAFVQHGAEIATRLILDLCGGESSELVTAGRPPLRDLKVPLRLDRVRTLAGVEIEPSEQLTMLQALGFTVAASGDRSLLTCRPGVPTSMAKPIWSRRSSASTGSTRSRMCPCPDLKRSASGGSVRRSAAASCRRARLPRAA
jgi:phenylalanyl-tRNA synthetase beta chain